MITGPIKSQIDQIWNTFWAGGIANPLDVIEQITLSGLHKMKAAYERSLERLDALFASLQHRAFRGEL